MNTFDIYEHPGNNYQVLVEQGFNWLSFLFGPFW
jgi:hypothetical protein